MPQSTFGAVHEALRRAGVDEYRAAEDLKRWLTV